jgi:transcription elongation factor GreA
MHPVLPQSFAPVLTAAGRGHVQERLERAREALAQSAERMSTGQGDPDELAEYQRQADLVDQLEAVLNSAADVTAVDEDPTIVEVGDEVDVEMQDGMVTYALVHPAEASPAAGRISAMSPLGRALLGTRPGDEVVVAAPGGSYACRVRARRRLA